MDIKNYRMSAALVRVLSVTLCVIWLSGGHKSLADEKLKPAPDFTLINQENTPIQLSELAGTIKVLTFIYTSCQMPNMCPLMTKNFREIQKSLGNDNNKVVFLMITFDPEVDIPGILKKYGQMYMADFANWHFLTGDPQTIDTVCDAYGIINEKQESGIIRHSMMTYIIDRDNNIAKMYVGNEWKPEDIYEFIIAE